MKIRMYKTNLGLFISRDSANKGGWSRLRLPDDYKYNGSLPQNTNHKDWLKVEGSELLSITSLVRGAKVNHRYQIKDLDDISENTPEFLSRKEVGYCRDEDYDITWASFTKYKSWYKEVYDTEEDRWEEEEFELVSEEEVEISDIKTPKKTTYTVQRTDYAHEGKVELDIAHIASYWELDEMLVPEFALQDRPCSITSLQSYKIVREYVKSNINPKMATVTSDYNFCFTVKRGIRVKPYLIQSEQTKKNGRSYAKPRISSREVASKQEEIFEMTNLSDNYRNYTPIRGFKGDSLQELCDNIKKYLDELMFYINKEVSECEHCGGTGRIVEDEFAMNKRGEK